jgi:hypothetical protein
MVLGAWVGSPEERSGIRGRMARIIGADAKHDGYYVAQPILGFAPLRKLVNIEVK